MKTEEKVLNNFQGLSPGFPRNFGISVGKSILKLIKCWKVPGSFPHSSSLPSALPTHKFNIRQLCQTLALVTLLPKVLTDGTSVVPWPAAAWGHSG